MKHHRISSTLVSRLHANFTDALLTALGFASLPQCQRESGQADTLVVHEWGTFTSVASRRWRADGLASTATAELPKFV